MSGIPAKESKGKYYERLFVLNVFKDKNKKETYAKCRCSCDKHLPKEERKIFITRLSSLRSGATSSCGCLLREVAIILNTKHSDCVAGGHIAVEYTMWLNMKQRCLNKNHPYYKDYGGRGIKIYLPWIFSYKKFLKYLLKYIGRRPSKKHSIDRIDNDGNYEPDNIRWSTKSQQQYNRRKFKIST